MFQDRRVCLEPWLLGAKVEDGPGGALRSQVDVCLGYVSLTWQATARNVLPHTLSCVDFCPAPLHTAHTQLSHSAVPASEASTVPDSGLVSCHLSPCLW